MTSSVRIHANDPCPCGSNKKYKRCCGSPEHQASRQRRANLIFGGIVCLVLAVAGGAIVLIQNSVKQNRLAPTAPPGKVWSAEHGHFHDINPAPQLLTTPANTLIPQQTGTLNPQPLTTPGPQPPGAVPEGQVWSPEHGHFHDANPTAQPTAEPIQS